MTKVVLNRDYGGFCLPEEIACEVARLTPELADEYASGRHHAPICQIDSYDLRVRSHPAVVAWAENSNHEPVSAWRPSEMGNPIEVIDIPDSVDLSECVIFDYDGIETVVERGHFWPSDGGAVLGGAPIS